MLTPSLYLLLSSLCFAIREGEDGAELQDSKKRIILHRSLIRCRWVRLYRDRDLQRQVVFVCSYLHLASHEKILDLAKQKRLRTLLLIYRTQIVLSYFLRVLP
jgi:hypothetical protein